MTFECLKLEILLDDWIYLIKYLVQLIAFHTQNDEYGISENIE